MRSVKAVAVKEPMASRIAAGHDTIAYRGSKTPYRGEVLIVSDAEPAYALALAQLVDVRPMSGGEKAPIRRGFVWQFGDVVPIARFPLKPQSGLWTASIPEGALPADRRSSLPPSDEAPPSRSAREGDESLKSGVAGDIRNVRASLRKAAGDLQELALRPGSPGGEPSFERMRAAIEPLEQG